MRSTAVILLSLVLTLSACTQSGEDRGPTEGRKIRVLATTGMVADVVRNVGGDRVAVDALMGPGVDPHLYKAGASDLTKLRAADVIAYNGHYLEGKMGKVLADCARSQTVVAIAEAIPHERLLTPAEGGHPDPHVWFDVGLWSETTAPVAEALARLDPTHADGYRQRAAAYRDRLLALDAEVRAKIATIPAERRVLVTSHDAFRYFGRAYAIDVTGLQGISTATEVSLSDRSRLVDLVLERGLKALFVESSVSPKAIEAVRQDCAARGREVKIGGTLYSDAMGESPPADTYVGMVRANVDRIVEALR